MIQSTDLRKGNIVENKELDIFKQGYVEISARHIYELAIKESGQFYNRCVDYFYPIKLTEEWLIKLGYKKDEFEIFSTQSKLFIYPMENINSFKATWRGSSIREIKYVHQLQNLYHALIGKELTIKE